MHYFHLRQPTSKQGTAMCQYPLALSVVMPLQLIRIKFLSVQQAHGEDAYLCRRNTFTPMGRRIDQKRPQLVTKEHEDESETFHRAMGVALLAFAGCQAVEEKVSPDLTEGANFGVKPGENGETQVTLKASCTADMLYLLVQCKVPAGKDGFNRSMQHIR